MKLCSLYLLLVSHSISSIRGLDCFSCQHVDDPADCNTSAVCRQNEVCFLDGYHGHYSMGCSSSQNCGATAAGTLVGRNIDQNVRKSSIEESIIAKAREIRQTTNCHECCSTDGCNKDLCKHLKPTQCIDDETLDCARLSTLFSICQDIHKAKSVCPRFCNLCGLVDGQWAHWTTWSECDVTCDKGVQTRTRSCTNPPPANGGLDCVGNKTETKMCQRDACPVHGGWSGWSDWGSCSATCDIGLERRDRNCSNPLPSSFGEHCFGDAHEDRICHSQPCADGGWSDWSSWGSCSVSCGGGIRSQTRTCSNPKPSVLGTPCLGAVDRVSLCNKQTCLDEPLVPVVAFKAQDLLNKSPNNGETLIFAATNFDKGSGYNNRTGVYTTPVRGVYLFTFQLCLNTGKYAYVELLSTDESIGNMFMHDDSGPESVCQRMTGIAILQANEQVRIKVVSTNDGSGVFWESVHAWNVFSGVLIKTFK